MSTTNADRIKKSDYTRPPRHGYLGRDCAGFDHHVDRARGVVFRFDSDGRFERMTDLGGHSLNTYKEWVDARVGWQTGLTMLSVDLMRATEEL